VFRGPVGRSFVRWRGRRSVDAMSRLSPGGLTSSGYEEDPDPSDFSYMLKVLLVGDSGVGKSSLLLRFCCDSFDPSQGPTIGVDFKIKMMRVPRGAGPHAGTRVKLAVWDTAGQERFRTLTSSYYRGSHGVFLVYDASRRDTFKHLEDVWLPELRRNTSGSLVMCVVAAKVDARGGGEGSAEDHVRPEEGETLAKSLGCLFLETSAKTRVGVRQAFTELVCKVLDTPSLARACAREAEKHGGGGATNVEDARSARKTQTITLRERLLGSPDDRAGCCGT